MKLIKYTKQEGGDWINVTGELDEEEVLSLPLLHHCKHGHLWGFIHSFVRQDGKRFDAFNDAFRKGVEVQGEIN